MRVRRGLVTAGLVVVSLAAAGDAWATQEPPGTAVVTPNPAQQSPPLNQLQVSPTGLTYLTQLPSQSGSAFTAYYRPFGGSAQVVASPAPNPQAIPDVLSVVNGVQALVQTDPNDASLVAGVTLEPLAGGPATTLAVDEYHERYLGSTGDGILVSHALQAGDFGIDVLLRRAGQPDELLDHLPANTSVTGLVDQDGAFLHTDVGSGELVYLNFAAHTATQVNTDPNDLSATIAFMTPTMLGWAGGLDHRTMVWTPRSGGSQTRLAVPVATASASGFTLSAGSVAFYAPAPGSLWTMYTMPADGSAAAAAVGLDVTAPHAVPAPGGGFLVAGRHSPVTFGLYQVAGTQATLFEPIAPAIAQAGALTMSSGRLVFTDDALAPPAVGLWSVQTSRSGGTVVLGGESQLAGDVSSPTATPLLASDARTAHVAFPASGRELVVMDGAAVERAVPFPTSVEAAGLSGDELLLHTIGTANWWTLNTVTGAQIPVTSSIAALGGRFLYYQGTGKGQIMRRDLTKPASASNPRQVRAGDGCGMLPGSLLGWGYWIAYHCGGTPTNNKVEAMNTSTKVVVPLDLQQLDRLGDGVLLYQNLGVLYARNLSMPATAPTAIGDLGSAGGAPLPQLYALDGNTEAAVWLAADRHLHVAPLPVAASAPSVLDSHVDAGLVAGGVWHADADLSKPVSWKLVIKTSAGTTVRSLTGTAVDASVRATWNGRNAKNAAVAPGTYAWKLTSTGLDALGKVTLSGTLTLA